MVRGDNHAVFLVQGAPEYMGVSGVDLKKAGTIRSRSGICIRDVKLSDRQARGQIRYT